MNLSQSTTGKKVVALLLSYVIFTKLTEVAEQHVISGALLIAIGNTLKMLLDNIFTSTKTKRVLTSSARDNGAKSTSDEELGTLPNSGENDERRPLV